MAVAHTSEAVWHDIECGAYSADLPFWRRLATQARKRSGKACELLELGCGTGRVSLALAGPECRVTALDIEPELIDVLRTRARERRAPIDARVGDACSFELESPVDLVLGPMLLAQLLSETERLRMFSSIARSLYPGGRAAFALFEVDEEWETDVAEAPPPDTLEKDGWVYSSHAVGVRLIIDEDRLELDRVRRTIPPDGEHTETLSRISLELISPQQLEAEARRAGLVAEPRLRIQATKEHVANTVVTLRHPAGHAGRPPK
jgi:SAM-dependent methyltransferase